MIYMPPSINNSSSTNWNQVNNIAKDMAQKERVQIYKDDTGTRRVLIGKGKNGFYGVKTTPTGVDVYNATDAELTFNSNQNVFKIVQSGLTTMSQITISGSSGTNNVVITHNLGYVPLVIAVFEDTTYGPGEFRPWVSEPGAVTVSAGFIEMISYHNRIMEATDSTVTFTEVYYWGSFPANNKTGPYNIKYYLLQETAN